MIIGYEFKDNYDIEYRLNGDVIETSVTEFRMSYDEKDLDDIPSIGEITWVYETYDCIFETKTMVIIAPKNRQDYYVIDKQYCSEISYTNTNLIYINIL